LDEPFIHHLTARCEAEGLFNISPETKLRYLILRLTFIILFGTAMYLAFYTGLNLWISIPLVVIQALIGTSLFGLIAHEHTHRNYPKNVVLRVLLRLSWQQSSCESRRC
jgi:fatty acid desaturase